MNADRLALAEALLDEAVYRSRARQAADVGLLRGTRSTGGNCGLGASAAVVLDLSERGQELFRELFPAGLADAQVARMNELVSEWVERQDRLDRKRNHFLKAFRQAHGSDRARYGATQIAEFEAGLAAVNAEIEAARRELAEQLLATLQPS